MDDEYNFVGSLNPRVNKEKSQEKFRSSNFIKNLLIASFIVLLVFGAFYLYQIYDGKLKSNINQSITTNVEPAQVDIPFTNNNNNNLETKNSYQNNYTIINNIKICNLNGSITTC